MDIYSLHCISWNTSLFLKVVIFPYRWHSRTFQPCSYPKLLRSPLTVMHAVLREGSLGCKFKDFGQQEFAEEKPTGVSATPWKKTRYSIAVRGIWLVTEKPFGLEILFCFTCLFFHKSTKVCRNKISLSWNWECGCNLGYPLFLHTDSKLIYKSNSCTFEIALSSFWIEWLTLHG